jgi:predicted amidohydrolase
VKLRHLELPHVHGDPQAQLARFDLLSTEPGELVLLPELAFTGYLDARGDFDLSPQAEPLGGPLSQALSLRAKQRGIWLAGAIVEREGARLYNTMTLHGPTGALEGRYRKRHPWFPETWASAGDEPHPLWTIGGLTVTAAICFDVHFLAEEAEAELRAADVLLFSSAWVEDEGDQRYDLLPALAREFGVWIVNANWGPGTPRFRTQGHSLMVKPDGTLCDASTVTIAKT